MGAAALPSGLPGVCTAAAGFATVVAMPLETNAVSHDKSAAQHAKNASALVSAADGVQKRVRHDAASQRVPIVPICSRVQSHRAAAALMLLPLETSAVTHNTPAAQHAKSADTSASGADRVYEASGTLSRSLAIHHHAWL